VSGERSGLLANSVCFVIANVFCGVLRGVLRCFVGVLRVFVVFCECFLKNSVLRCFADVLQCFGRVLHMFFVNIF